MGCNAWNHPANCRCGWGGDGHKGKSPGGWKALHSHELNSNEKKHSRPETLNHKTTCPMCGSDVFFIRHNGGSVWLDLPLSYPWYKHACFDSETESSGRRNFLAQTIDERKHRTSSTELFTIIQATTFPRSTTTNIKGWLAGENIYSLTVTGDARILAGELCFIDISTKELWSEKKPSIKFSMQGSMARISREIYFEQQTIEFNKHQKPQSSALINCNICDVALNPKNLEKHLLKAHSAAAITFNGRITGLLLKDSTQNVTKPRKPEILKKLRKEELNCTTEEAKTILERATKELEGCNEWVKLSDVGAWINKNVSSFSVKNFGFKKMSQLVESLDGFETTKKPQPKNPSAVEIYIKTLKNSAL
ncbi:OST-HTH/LOTUS domain-containing protein [Salinicola sp. MIT1003]|uniref:OST-HTH/LOTUS domain-containing protein n=1 Tax=Salinicola sp. MIT1003 TaxID=1882734 RepID=UPI0009F616C4|nr:OST-HTH/LOTUS domain-containing protein [Salinicola sp. MIT1003]